MGKQSRGTVSSHSSLAFQAGGQPLLQRPAAALLMLVGAAGFILSLVVYDQQLICLLSSTLLTFVGLGFMMVARRRQQGQPGAGENSLPEDSPPAALTPLEVPEPAEEAPAPETAGLTDFAVATFQRWGAEVMVETQRADRSLLQIHTADGKTYVALVLESLDTVDQAEARALYALITNAGGQGGFLISEGSMESQAEQWARKRRIALVNREWLNGADMQH